MKKCHDLFLDKKDGISQVRLNMIREVADGIQGFFNAFVGSQLLYKRELVMRHNVHSSLTN